MELKDFIYQYAKYNKINVDAVLLMENWADVDYDEKYADYLKEYVDLKKIFVNTENHPSIDASFNKMKSTRAAEVYNHLLNLMFQEFDKNGIVINPPKKETIINRLNKTKSTDTDINFNYISELRKIEEEEY
jgi:hypothetical protein